MEFPPKKRKSPLLPYVTLEAQIEQIEADNALAEQLRADEQMVADNALALQLQAPHSITVPRVWPGQIPEPTNTPGARGPRDVLLPDPNDPAAPSSSFQKTIGGTEEQTPRDDPRHPRTLDEARTQTTAPTSATIGRSVQLPPFLEQPTARNEPFQDERKHKENPTRTRTTDQHRPGLRMELQLSISMYCAYVPGSE